MTNNELVRAIASKTGETIVDTSKFMKALTEVVYDTIAQDEVKIINGVTLYMVQKDAHTGKNPKTGEPIEVPARLAPKCRFGVTFKRLGK